MTTPGYNRRIAFAFTADRNGRPVAYYWSRGSLTAGRWIRAPYEQSKLLVALGSADEIPYSGPAARLV
jgi:hypothetical protein